MDFPSYLQVESQLMHILSNSLIEHVKYIENNKVFQLKVYLPRNT